MSSDSSARPNVLVIMSDDQGAWAMRCAGNTDLRTPNLDRLAQTGIRFESCFCASPVCSPARASFLTGRMPSQHGVHDWIRKGNVEDPEGQHGYDQPVEYLAGMLGYTEVLAENGYRCALSGKWHMGASQTPQKGFQHWFTHGFGGGPYYGWTAVRDGKLYKEPGYVTDVFTDEALRFLDTHGDGPEPWYLHVTYTAPHSPWDRDNHPAEVWETYNDCGFTATPDLPLHPWQANTAPQGTGERRKELLHGYYTAITAMDTQIGRILDWLEAHDQRGNTLVVFTSDNGMNMGHHGIWGKGNGTFPMNLFDTSCKVPLIFSRPGQIPQGLVEERMVCHYDFMPTLLDYLGYENPAAQQLPRSSYAPLLVGGDCPEREAIVMYDEYGPVRMIRTREHKYIHRYPYGPNEFYDLREDPEERHNLISEPDRKGLINELKLQMEQWFNRYVIPEFDGIRQPVNGRGQLDRVDVVPWEGRTFDTDIKLSDDRRSFYFDEEWPSV
jgi:choline-sulfatase